MGLVCFGCLVKKYDNLALVFLIDFDNILPRNTTNYLLFLYYVI